MNEYEAKQEARRHLNGNGRYSVTHTADQVLAYKPPLRSVRVFYSNGNDVTTAMAAGLSDADIRAYFAIGREFNVGNGPDDEMATVTGVNILS